MMGGDGNESKSRKQTERFQFGPWLLCATKSHILKSEGQDRENFEAQLELPQFPEMIFADNILRIEHNSGFGLEFSALDALKLVDAHTDPLKVAVSQEWKEARSDCEHINDVIKPFDWSYTTDYKGTLLGKPGAQLQVIPTEERIDIEKLKVREKIMFYEDLLLFEDELADNGTSMLSVKIRVMPTSFFILMRFFLRVDNVLVRVNDTRIYHEASKDYILREYTSRDDSVKDIKAPSHLLREPNEIVNHLSVRTEICEKLQFPKDSVESSSDNVQDSTKT
ncbi:hypothetical protein FSP39_016204 [Pinctada imbricata]|uniref:TIP41-like protein n=1 Tax=Pinctada imbricata TaxID=66713 RepID=A0AA88Y5M5_PINIB|nr:hypothetical protein FSP39_016204 [Pinctada imbricata]